MDNKSQKILAFVAIFMLLVVYKETVLDPYLGGHGVNGVGTPSQGASPRGIGLPDAAVQPGQVNSATTERIASPAPGVVTEQALTNSSLDKQAVSPPKFDDILSAGLIEINTETIHATISLKGGRVVDLRLRKFAETQESDSSSLNLVPRISGVDFPLPLGVQTGSSSDLNTLYTLESTNAQFVDRRSAVGAASAKSASITGNDVLQFNLHGTLSDGTPVVKSLEFFGSGYFFDVNVVLAKPEMSYEITWDRYIPEKDPALTNAYTLAEFVWYDGARAARESLNALTGAGSGFPELQWISLGDQYFMASLLAPAASQSGPDLRPGRFYRSGNLFGMRLSGPLSHGVSSTSVHEPVQVYVGPKNYSDLQKIGREFQLNVNLGKTGFISAPLLSVLHLLYAIFGNYGVAVVLLTIIVKLLTYPLSHSSFKQMKAMQEISPEMKRIRESVKDQAQQQQELMALYKKRGVNPFGGCLPMFLQLPIFIGLYSALSLDVELRHARFAFWIQDLSAKEAMPFFGIGIPVMAILMVLAMMVQQWITPSTADPMQKKIMLAMPVIMGFMFMNLPAGLTLYFLTNSIISITQTQGLYQGSKASSGLLMTLGASLVMFTLALLMSKIG